MCSSAGFKRTLSQFALVSYLPDPLASFLDALRLELTPNCNPRAHVTVLPPRPVTADLDQAVAELNREGSLFSAFVVEVGEIEVFPLTNVIYLSLRQGERSLYALEKILNSGDLQYNCPFPFHPHITIAQDFPPESMNALVRRARAAWAGYTGPRIFPVERLSFVQHVAPFTWVDVAKVPLDQQLSIESAA